MLSKISWAYNNSDADISMENFNFLINLNQFDNFKFKFSEKQLNSNKL